MKTFFIHILGIVLLIGLIIKFPHEMINPGGLSTGHQELRQQCLACHAPLQGIKPEKCLTCHKLDKIGVVTVAGNPVSEPRTVTPFHEALFTKDCLTCHTEHKGRQTERSFTHFSHDLLMESVKDNCVQCHQFQVPEDPLHNQMKARCALCHSTSGWQIVNFDHSFLKSVPRVKCVSCHVKDVPNDVLHRGIRMSCEQCHTPNKWKPATFEHDRYFRFDRQHPPECESCHQNLQNFRAYTCYGCHEHSPRKIAAEHYEEGIREFENCVECHRSGDEEAAKRKWRQLKRRDRSRERIPEEFREHDDDDDHHEDHD